MGRVKMAPAGRRLGATSTLTKISTTFGRSSNALRKFERVMRNVIQQSVTFPATAHTLFEMYITPAGHEAITGAKVIIGAEKGADFRAFDGMLTGSILAVVRPTLIVQSWRSMKFKPDDSDSTLVLTFSPEEDAGRIDLVHLDVPDHDYDGVNQGWEEHYWIPWRRYLENR